MYDYDQWRANRELLGLARKLSSDSLVICVANATSYLLVAHQGLQSSDASSMCCNRLS